MRNIFAVTLILFSILTFSQSSNPFSEHEVTEDHTPVPTGYTQHKVDHNEIQQDTPCDQENDCNCDGIPDTGGDEDCGPPNPGDPVPIDENILLLVLSALGIIIYCNYNYSEYKC